MFILIKKKACIAKHFSFTERFVFLIFFQRKNMSFSSTNFFFLLKLKMLSISFFTGRTDTSFTDWKNMARPFLVTFTNIFQLVAKEVQKLLCIKIVGKCYQNLRIVLCIASWGCQVLVSSLVCLQGLLR